MLRATSSGVGQSPTDREHVGLFLLVKTTAFFFMVFGTAPKIRFFFFGHSWEPKLTTNSECLGDARAHRVSLTELTKNGGADHDRYGSTGSD